MRIRIDSGESGPRKLERRCSRPRKPVRPVVHSLTFSQPESVSLVVQNVSCRLAAPTGSKPAEAAGNQSDASGKFWRKSCSLSSSLRSPYKTEISPSASVRSSAGVANTE